MALPGRLSNQVVRRKDRPKAVREVRSPRRVRNKRGGGGRLKFNLNLSGRIPSIPRSLVLRFFKTAVAAALLAVFAVAVVNGYNRVQASGEFSLQTVEVRGLANLGEEEIVSASGLKKGDNILEVSLDEVQRRLKVLPRVKEATVIRRLPSTVVMEVQERRPVALIQWNGEMKLVDREGVYFSVFPGREQWQLPIVTGAVFDGTPEGRPIRQTALTNALEVLSLLDPAALAVISEVYAEAGGSVTLFTTGRHTKIILGQGGFAEKVARLNHAQSVFASRGEVKDIIDLRYKDVITRP